MKTRIFFIISLILTMNIRNYAQDDSTTIQLHRFQILLKKLQENRFADSLRKIELQNRYNLLKSDEGLEKEHIQSEFNTIKIKDSLRMADMAARADYLKKNAVGYPVTLMSDTIFKLYTRIGASTPQERAVTVTKRIKRLYDDDFFKPDSLTAAESENTVDIAYGDLIIVSISDLDALINNTSKKLLAKNYVLKISNAISTEKEKNGIWKILIRIGLMILVIAGISLLIWLIEKGHKRTASFITDKKEKWLKDLTYKDYTFLSSDQEIKLLYFIMKLIKWFFIIILLYLVLPLIFSIFPFTRGWADLLFGLVWTPFKGIFISFGKFLPNLFSILVIFFVMKYVIRFVRYIFSEIGAENLKINGFHPDWAKPTFGIIRFLLYAFMFILIFPYLPGSNSQVFKGVSVFLGILFSLGSSSAIANMVAGLVITYMRPFKIGDRIKIGEITGDVIEKNMLVTRVRTIKNEEITIPNSSVLSGNTTNYSSIAKNDGLIIHTTVTIGYDIPWKDMYQALIEAALRTELILREPMPFVLQTSLDDFYVSYQINAYTKDPAKQANIYSDLHKNIQDVCNERGLEILSPHYTSIRDGNITSIPSDYLPKSYKAPGFNINVSPNDKKD